MAVAKTCTLRVISLCFIAARCCATGIGLMVNKSKTSADDELLRAKQFRKPHNAAFLCIRETRD
jgi:hypothetical protein